MGKNEINFTPLKFSKIFFGARQSGRKALAGFTLIELLVVIAIIGLLATIVMVSLNSARANAANASVKANLKTIITQAVIAWDSVNSYAAVCVDTTVEKALGSAAGAGGGALGASPYACTNSTSEVCCNQATATWVVAAPLKGGGTWCVDSVGSNRLAAADVTAASTVCP